MKGWWWFLILGADVIFTTRWMNKKPKETKDIPTPMTAPTVQDGVNIPVLFGSRMIKSPMIAWWGDVSITKVEVPGGGKKG